MVNQHCQLSDHGLFGCVGGEVERHRHAREIDGGERLEILNQTSLPDRRREARDMRSEMGIESVLQLDKENKRSGPRREFHLLATG
jgi:hypothetical protein